MRPGRALSRSLATLDIRGIDGMVTGLAQAIGIASARIRLLQNGFVRSYGLGVLIGVTVIVAAMSLARL